MKNQIKVFDGLVPFADMDRMMSFVSASKFQIGWSDQRDLRANNHAFLFASYDHDDLVNLGLLPVLVGTPVFDILSDYEVTRCIVNLDVPTNVHVPHTHGGAEDVVLLYYVNLQWEQAWAGETMFFTNDGVDVREAIAFRPGRIALFDANIPHCVRPQSSAGPDYRFTVALGFKKKEQ